MSEKKVALGQQAQSSFQNLAQKATTLNQVSDELSKPIESLV